MVVSSMEITIQLRLPVEVYPSEPTTTSWAQDRKKRYHRKTRDGCSRCRQRRVKCDEHKPSCHRCLDRNETCHYDRSPADWGLTRHRPSPIPTSKFDLSHLRFYAENTADMLSFSPGLPVATTSPVFFSNYHASVSKFWRLLVLPVAYQEPYVLDLISILAKQHRQLLTTSRSDFADYSHLLNVMSKIVETRPLEIVIVGATLVFAYECLRSAMSSEDPANRSQVHSNAFMKLLPMSSAVIMERMKPLVILVWTMKTFGTGSHERRPVLVPDHFENYEEAGASFSSLVHSSNLRPALEQWLRVSLRLYEQTNIKDWEARKTLLTMLDEGQLLLIALGLRDRAK